MKSLKPILHDILFGDHLNGTITNYETVKDKVVVEYFNDDGKNIITISMWEIIAHVWYKLNK
jgi:hypothetical protein